MFVLYCILLCSFLLEYIYSYFIRYFLIKFHLMFFLMFGYTPKLACVKETTLPRVSDSKKGTCWRFEGIPQIYLEFGGKTQPWRTVSLCRRSAACHCRRAIWRPAKITLPVMLAAKLP